MKKLWIMAAALVLILGAAGYTIAQSTSPGPQGGQMGQMGQMGMMGPGMGMMGSGMMGSGHMKSGPMDPGFGMELHPQHHPDWP